MCRDSHEEDISADRMTTITFHDLMKEIENATVEKQSDLLNKVKLMKAKHRGLSGCSSAASGASP